VECQLKERESAWADCTINRETFGPAGPFKAGLTLCTVLLTHPVVLRKLVAICLRRLNCQSQKTEMTIIDY
jgi:hypothetical protein